MFPTDQKMLYVYFKKGSLIKIADKRILLQLDKYFCP